MIIHVVKQSVPTGRIALHQDDEDVWSVCLAWDSVVSGARELQMTTFLLYLNQPKNIIPRTRLQVNKNKLMVGRRTRQRHRGASIDEVAICWNVCGMISGRHLLFCLFFTEIAVQRMRVCGYLVSNTKTTPRTCPRKNLSRCRGSVDRSFSVFWVHYSWQAFGAEAAAGSEDVRGSRKWENKSVEIVRQM